MSAVDALPGKSMILFHPAIIVAAQRTRILNALFP
jgi:hypothetical protein